MKRKRTTAAVVVIMATLPAACSDSATVTESTPSSSDAIISADQTGCADVIDVVVTPEDSGTYRFDVTVRSADTGEERYADL